MMMKVRLGLRAATLVVTVLTLGFFTPLSAPLAYGLAVLCGLMVVGTTCWLNDKRESKDFRRKP